MKTILLYFGNIVPTLAGVTPKCIEEGQITDITLIEIPSIKDDRANLIGDRNRLAKDFRKAIDETKLEVCSNG